MDWTKTHDGSLIVNVRVKVGKESEYWEVESTSKGVRELVYNAIAKKAGNCQLKKLRTKHPNIWLTSTHLRIKGSSIPEVRFKVGVESLVV